MADILSLTNLSDKKTGLILEKFASSLTKAKNEAELLEVNEKIGQYGLVLTQDEVREIVAVQHKSLADNDRIELGAGAAVKITEKFAQSGFIERNDFASEISDIIDLFYYIKTEVRDSVSDDDLIDTLYEFYTDKCAGSFELLSGREVEYIIRYFNNEKDNILELDEEDDYNSEPEFMERKSDYEND